MFFTFSFILSNLRCLNIMIVIKRKIYFEKKKTNNTTRIPNPPFRWLQSLNMYIYQIYRNQFKIFSDSFFSHHWFILENNVYNSPSLLHRESTFRLFNLRSWNRLMLSRSHGPRLSVIIPEDNEIKIYTNIYKYSVSN